MQIKFNFFEPENTPERIHIGLRTIKTVVAVFISALMGFIRGQSPMFAMIAAVLCMQPDTEKTLIFSLNRILGTIIGACSGVGIVYLAEWTGIIDILPVYYLIVSLVLIPIILLSLIIKKPSITAFSCVVFIGVTLSRMPGISPHVLAVERMIDTIVGIAAALIVNLALPYSKPCDDDGFSDPEPLISEDGATEDIQDMTAENKENRDI